MALPSYVKITRDGVEFISGLERCQYTIKELSRAALRDVGKYISRLTRKKIKRRTGRARRYVQFWVRSKQEYPDLKIGYKQAGFYGSFLELGTSTISKQAPLYEAVMDNIDMIRKIEGQYLSAIENENRALGLIDENEAVDSEND